MAPQIFNNKKHNILIVDDIPTNLNFLSEALFLEGFGIILATNGKDAINIAREKKPDIILLDIAMPHMDGYEVCSTLKSDPNTSDIPVIYLTARTDSEDVLKGFETGAADYILKPFNSAELVARVKTQLELKDKSLALQQMNTILEEQVKQRTSELTASNAELKQANLKLQQAYKELSNLDQAKDEFIRHINHELRTPLQGIHGFTLILEDITSSPEQIEYIQSINQLVKRLVKLSEITLLFTEIKANNYKLNLKPVQLKETIEMATVLFPGKRIVVNPVITADEIYINADQKLLTTCLEQIVDNALKYSASTENIDINLTKNEDTLSLVISDKGPGFSGKAMTSLYKLFAADNLPYRLPGFGIGLATTKILLDTMNAELKIHNLPEKGAQVSMIFKNQHS